MKIDNKSSMKGVNKKLNYSLFIGRYMPPHVGHVKLMRKVLNEGKGVVIALRDTEISEKNPYTMEQRAAIFEKLFDKEVVKGKVRIIGIPDIFEVCYGRNVGYKIREIRLDEKTENISGTKIRKQLKQKNGSTELKKPGFLHPKDVIVIDA